MSNISTGDMHPVYKTEYTTHINLSMAEQATMHKKQSLNSNNLVKTS